MLFTKALRAVFCPALAIAAAMLVGGCAQSAERPASEQPDATEQPVATEQQPSADAAGTSHAKSDGLPSAAEDEAASDKADGVSGQAWESESEEAKNLLEEADACLYGAPGADGVDFDKAKELYGQAAEQGSPYAMYMLGEMVLMGDIDDIDQAFSEQEDWYAKAFDAAAAMPEQGAEYNLVMGLIAAKTSYAEDAVQYLETAASGTEPYAAYAMMGLADYYRNGAGSDAQQAVAWYEAAADAGYTRAIPLLASFYQVELDDQETAVAWYEKAIEAGYSSWYGLGTSYFLLDNYEGAFQAYEQGYEAGNIACAYGLGNMYFATGDVESALQYYAEYLNGREPSTTDSYTDYNEQRIREYAQTMVDNGATDVATVESYLGEGFLDS